MSTKYGIPRNLIEKALRETSDTRIRVNHENCFAGTDTRNRLYIERKDYGDVAHCFNCGESGFIPAASTQGNKFRKRFAEYAENSEHDATCIPPNVDFDIGRWSNEARSWILQYGITSTDIERYKIGYSPFFGGVILPLCNSWLDKEYPQSIYGYVLRYTDSTYRQGSKYSFKLFRDRERNVDVWESIPVKTKHHLDLVLCEDILSAIKCRRVEYILSMALLRTTLDMRTLNHIFNMYKDKRINRILIHLDNDRAVVRKHSRDILNKLNILIPGNKLVIIKGKRDPKHYAISDLRNLYG